MNDKRPRDFTGYIGQEQAKRRLFIEIHATKANQGQLRHVLLSGPPGLGKTTLSKIIAGQFGKALVETTGPAIKNEKHLISTLKNMEPGGFLLIDEIHKLNKDVQEYLLVVLEDFEVDEETGRGANKTLTKTTLPPFTMIGATTRVSDIDRALRARFGIQEILRPYHVGEICEITKRYIEKRGFDARDEQAMISIARRSRQTPRLALDYADGIMSYGTFHDTKCVSWSLVEEYFSDIHRVDQYGLTETDRRFLRALAEDGCLSIKRWASKVGEHATELEEVYEPYYVKMGLVDADSRGRVATAKLMQTLGLNEMTTNIDTKPSLELN
jgi:Holliday junction DNA helicase RuvB